MLRQQELHLYIYGNVLITYPVFLPCFQLSTLPPPPAFFHPPPSSPSAILSTFSIFHYYTIHFLHITLPRCLITPVSFYQLFFYTRHIYTTIFLLVTRMLSPSSIGSSALYLKLIGMDWNGNVKRLKKRVPKK